MKKYSFFVRFWYTSNTFPLFFIWEEQFSGDDYLPTRFVASNSLYPDPRVNYIPTGEPVPRTGECVIYPFPKTGAVGLVAIAPVFLCLTICYHYLVTNIVVCLQNHVFYQELSQPVLRTLATTLEQSSSGLVFKTSMTAIFLLQICTV